MRAKKVTPHALRHTAAMRLLKAGIDTTVIALWLGHGQVDATHIYLHADLAIKEQALARTASVDGRPGRYRPARSLLAFLEALWRIVSTGDMCIGSIRISSSPSCGWAR